MANSDKKKLIRLFALIMAICITILLFSACSAEPVSDTEPTPPVLLPVATEQPAAQTGGELRMPMPSNADVYDPLSVNTQEMYYLFSLIFESVVAIDNTGMIIPGIAENWSVDESGLVWTFNLRSAARWHDSSERVLAGDVKATFDRIQSLVTAGEYCYYSYVTDAIERMEALSESVLEVTTYSPGMSALYALTFPVMREGTVNSTAPIGTGPYKTVYIADDEINLVVNEGWWKQRPYIDSINFYARDNNDIAISSYTAGQLNMVPTSAVSIGRYREEGVTKIVDYMTQTVEVMLLNFDNTELVNISMRKAIAYALNRGRIITNIYMNRAQACDVPIAPDSWIYESKSKVYDYNTATALALFAEAGWADTDDDGYLEKDGHRYEEMTLRLLVNESTDTTRLSAANMIASQLEDIGIHVEVVTAAYALEADENEYTTMLENGDFDIALAGFNLARSGDLRAYVAPNGTRNYGGYNNAAFTQLVTNMLTARDEADYRSAASVLQTNFAEELPFITLYFRYNSLLCSSEIEGLTSAVRGPDIFRNVDKWYIASNS